MKNHQKFPPGASVSPNPQVTCAASGSSPTILPRSSSFLTLLRFRCPEVGSAQSLLGAPGLRQQRLLDYRFTINEHCHRIPLAFPNEGGVASYRATLENPNDFSSNVSGVKVARWSEIMDTRLLQPHVCCLPRHRMKFDVTLTGF